MAQIMSSSQTLTYPRLCGVHMRATDRIPQCCVLLRPRAQISVHMSPSPAQEMLHHTCFCAYPRLPHDWHVFCF